MNAVKQISWPVILFWNDLTGGYYSHPVYYLKRADPIRTRLDPHIFSIRRGTDIDITKRTGMEEGSPFSKAMNKIPGINAVAGMHDYFQNTWDKLQGTQYGSLREMLNVPGMLPAATLTYTALISDYTSCFTIQKSIY